MLTEHFPPDGNKILNVASENFRAKILNIEFLRSRILDIDSSVLISIFGVVASSVRARRVADTLRVLPLALSAIGGYRVGINPIHARLRTRIRIPFDH